MTNRSSTRPTSEKTTFAESRITATQNAAAIRKALRESDQAELRNYKRALHDMRQGTLTGYLEQFEVLTLWMAPFDIGYAVYSTWPNPNWIVWTVVALNLLGAIAWKTDALTRLHQWTMRQRWKQTFGNQRRRGSL